MCTVPARCSSGFVQGTGSDRAKSTLAAALPNRKCRRAPRLGAGSWLPAIRSIDGTLVSKNTALAGVRSPREWTSRPVSIVPPWATRSAASASTIAWLPPIGTGQPRAWA